MFRTIAQLSYVYAFERNSCLTVQYYIEIYINLHLYG